MVFGDFDEGDKEEEDEEEEMNYGLTMYEVPMSEACSAEMDKEEYAQYGSVSIKL